MKKTILLLAILQGIFTRVLSQEPYTPNLSGIDKADAASWAFNDAKNHHSGALAKLLAPTLYGQQNITSGDKSYDVSVERIVIDAKASGDFTVSVISNNTKPDQFIEVQVQDLTGKIVGAPIQVAATDKAEIKKEFSQVKTWNPENPHLYQAVINIKDASQQVLHTYTQKFGFRTVEAKGAEGIFINGSKVIFKGINRRNNEPGGSTAEAYAQYINTLKDLNMNAVRIPDNSVEPIFYELCDSLGLFVVSDLGTAGTGKNAEAAKKHLKEVVLRDVNHPCIVMWSIGSESLDNECRTLDLQQRVILHPSVKEAETKKGADFKDVANSILYGSDAYYPSEVGNGIYFGGRAAGLEDFWNEMTKQQKFSGAFISSYKDEKESADSDDKGANYFTIKEVFAPIAFDPGNINVNFNGNLNVENRFLFTNLNKCRFDWKLVLFPKATERRTNYGIVAEGTGTSPFTAPGEKGVVKLALPAGMTTISDALLVSVYDAKGNEIYTQNFAVHRPSDVLKTAPEVTSISTIMRTEDDNFLSLVTDGINYIFDKKTGNLTKVYCGKRDIPFIGPFLAGAETTMADFKHLEKDNVHLVEITYKGENTLFVRWTFKTGDLPKMEYQYSIAKSPSDYVGITFKYPEEKIVGMKWMGRGPWQVWKNRMKGQQIGIWEKSNRVSATGEPPKNAEFKGWHSEIYWIQFQTNMGNFTIYTDQSDIYLQLFNPLQSGMAANEFSNPPFPENGNIGFMHNISGLGTKYQPAEASVSKSLKSVKGNEPLSGTLWIDFRW